MKSYCHKSNAGHKINNSFVSAYCVADTEHQILFSFKNFGVVYTKKAWYFNGKQFPTLMRLIANGLDSGVISLDDLTSDTQLFFVGVNEIKLCELPEPTRELVVSRIEDFNG